MSRAGEQREAFAQVCSGLGPDAPTLIDSWTTKELVAHVYVREHRLDAAPGVLPLGPWPAYTERVMSSALRVHGYDDLLEQVRTPPPWLRAPAGSWRRLRMLPTARRRPPTSVVTRTTGGTSQRC